MNGTPRRMERAVVIGASIGGLLAARMLSNHFRQVVIVERDVIPPPGDPRKGVPQGRHIHVLLSRGRDLLEASFPGLTDELMEKGAQVGDLSETVIWYSAGAYTKNFRSGLTSVQVSRPLLESVIYRRLCFLPNITVLENHDAAGLLHEPDGSEQRVTGVRVVDRSATPPVEKTLTADLVVDAGGRGSRCMAWLEALGYPRPEEEFIKVDIGYTTRAFRRLPEHAGGKSPVVIMPSFHNRRAGIMLAVEGGRWLVALTGFLGQSAPPDLDGFIEYARGLDAPDIYNVLKDAEPIGEPAQFRYPASQRRHFEKLERFPEGYVVVGDALCSFNPIYGQGMTTAAVEADQLNKCLRAGLPGVAMRFYALAGKLLDSPWQISAGSDLAYPEVEGKRTLSMKIAGVYLTRLLLAARADAELNVAFQKVTNLIEPPESLFAPRVMLRVLRAGLRGTGNGR